MTVSIISPPPRNGGSASSSSWRPHSTPMPVGPHILWPVNATKSAPRACTSSGMCGAACEASTTTSAPTSWARRTSSSGGLTVPRMLDTSTNDTTLVRSVMTLVEVGQVEPALVGQAEPAQRRAGALR